MHGLLARWLPELARAATAIGLARIADGCPGRALLLAEGEGLALQAHGGGGAGRAAAA